MILSFHSNKTIETQYMKKPQTQVEDKIETVEDESPLFPTKFMNLNLISSDNENVQSTEED